MGFYCKPTQVSATITSVLLNFLFSTVKSVAYLTWKVHLKLQNLPHLLFQISNILFSVLLGISRTALQTTLMSRRILLCNISQKTLKHPFEWISPYHLLHINSWRYSIRKLGFVLPLIFLNFSFAVDQLLSACCVCTPVTRSTKCKEWLTVLWFKPSCVCIWRYAAHWSVCRIEPGCTWRCIMPKRVAALRRLTSCRYERAGTYCVSNKPSTHFSHLGRLLLWNCEGSTIPYDRQDFWWCTT